LVRAGKLSDMVTNVWLTYRTCVVAWGSWEEGARTYVGKVASR
jgi:hypothetical protein